MRIGAWLVLAGISGLVSACSGTTILGTGATGTGGGGASGASGGASVGLGGSGSSVGGSGAIAGGTGAAQCAGKACGALCDDCGPQDTSCTAQYCAADGSCRLDFPVCGGQSTDCQKDGDCVAPGVCQACPDGSYVCPKASCNAGKCVTSSPACASECQKDNDCMASVAPCEPCSDGSKSCPTVKCVAGKCQGSAPGCPSDPCAGLSCGASCNVCNRAESNCGTAADVVPGYCDFNRKCQTAAIGPYFPDCSGGAVCKTTDDCGVPPPECVPCAFGGCATLDCFANQCVFSCPVPVSPQCKVSSDCITDAICKQCADTSCATTECVSGSCQQVCPG